MPKVHLTTAEAAALARKRKRDKAHNTSVTACIDAVKKRSKGEQDPVVVDTLHHVLTDLRRLIRS